MGKSATIKLFLFFLFCRAVDKESPQQVCKNIKDWISAHLGVFLDSTGPVNDIADLISTRTAYKNSKLIQQVLMVCRHNRNEIKRQALMKSSANYEGLFKKFYLISAVTMCPALDYEG